MFCYSFLFPALLWWAAGFSGAVQHQPHCPAVCAVLLISECFSPVKWGRWHFVFTALSAQHCALFFLSSLKSKSNFKKLLVAQAVLLAAWLLFGQE